MLSHQLRRYRAAAAQATDADFKQTTLLLHGDGTNGGQNNSFTDGSTNNFTITRNGNTTQGTFSPFSVADGEWSNYFDGSGDYLTVPAGSAFAYGTGDFTVEGWFYSTATLPQFGATLFAQTVSGTNYFWIYLGDGTSSNPPANKVAFNFATSGGGTAVVSGATTFNQNAWNHFAIVRSGTSVTVYLNGVGGTAVTCTQDFNNTTYVPTIGRYTHTASNLFTGYLSNIRVLKGTALYTSNFTVPTAPLTAVTNTSLLTCQSNYFKDNSSNNFTITRNGDVSVQPFSPYAPTSAYSTSVNGGSLYFNGTSDYLTSPASSFALGTGDFTVEMWIYWTTIPSSDTSFIGGVGSGSGSNIGIFNFATNIGIVKTGGGTTVYFGNKSQLKANQWNHLAITRSGTSHRCFINGVLDTAGVVTSSADWGSPVINYIASQGGTANYFNGTLSNLRVVLGTAIYTANFTPPTAPLTAISGTQLLLSGTNAGIYDNAIKNDLITVGNAQISTTVKKYGTGSMSFDGNGDYLINSGNTDLFAFGSGDFTIEMWVYGTTFGSGFRAIYDQRPTSTNGLYPTLYVSNSVLYYYTNSANRITGPTLSLNVWYHIALTRSGTNTRLFVNGVQQGSTYTDSNVYLNTAGRPWIGQFSDSPFPSGTDAGNCWNGFIDDFRITKGIARYTANFTPPTAAFPDNS